MADLDQLKRALVNADKAGDVAAAQAFAKAIRQQLSAPKTEEKPLNATDGMSTTQKVLAGVGMSMVDAKNGLGQMLGLVDQKEIDQAKMLNKDLVNTGAGTVGSVIGNAAMLAPTALIPGANTVTGAGLINALAGAAMTPGSLSERGQAALFSGGGAAGATGAVKLLSGAGRAAQAAAAPMSEKGREMIVGEVMRRAAGQNVDDVISRMKGAQALVPGAEPTAAEVANSGGIAALQRAMAQANPEAYTARGMQNATARVDALRGIAGDELSLQSARTARDGAADVMYGKAFKADAMRRDLAKQTAKETAWMTEGGAVPMQDLATDGLRSLAQRPGFKTAIDQAKVLAANKGVRLDDPLQSLEGLHYIKLALDDIASPKAGASSMGRNEVAAVNGMRESLAKELETISPLYGVAKQNFAEMSKPINQMQVGQELMNKLQPALVQFHPDKVNFAQTGNSYANALNDVRGNLVKNSTGGIKQSLEDVMTPQQMQTLNAIGQDLSRKSMAQSLGRGEGSNTFQNFAMDNLASQSGMPPAVSALGNFLTLGQGSKLMGGLKIAGNKLYQGADDKMKQSMADYMLNPQQAALAMENAVKPSGLSQAFNNALGANNVDRLMGAASVAPGILGSSFAMPYGSQ